MYRKQYIYYWKREEDNNNGYIILSSNKPDEVAKAMIIYDCDNNIYYYSQDKEDLNAPSNLKNELEVIEIYKNKFIYREKIINEFFNNVKKYLEKEEMSCEKILYPY